LRQPITFIAESLAKQSLDSLTCACAACRYTRVQVHVRGCWLAGLVARDASSTWDRWDSRDPEPACPPNTHHTTIGLSPSQARLASHWRLGASIARSPSWSGLPHRRAYSSHIHRKRRLLQLRTIAVAPMHLFMDRSDQRTNLFMLHAAAAAAAVYICKQEEYMQCYFQAATANPSNFLGVLRGAQ